MTVRLPLRCLFMHRASSPHVSEKQNQEMNADFFFAKQEINAQWEDAHEGVRVPNGRRK